MAEAIVIAFPKAKKRGRKVSTGPAATVSSIRPTPTSAPAPEPEFDQLVAVAVAKHAIRKKLWDDFLNSNPKVIRFPPTAWVRIPQVVRGLMSQTEAAFRLEANILYSS